MEPIKIMIVDDEPIIRKALKLELNGQPHNVACGMNDDGEVDYRGVTVLDTFANGAQLMTALDSPVPHEMPDYLLLDIEFQGEPTGGIFIAERVHKKYPNIKIAIFSGRFDNPLPDEGNRHERMLEIARVVFESLQHGAQAFVSKNAAGGFSVEAIVNVPRARDFSSVEDALRTVGDVRYSQEFEIALVKNKDSTAKLFGGGQVSVTSKSLEGAKNMFEKRCIDDLPVCDRNGRVVGLVDIQDLPRMKVL